jgi:hypothetical protein
MMYIYRTYISNINNLKLTTMSDSHDRAYNEAYEAGRHAGVLDSITHCNPYNLTHGSDSHHAASYRAGWEDSGKDQYYDSYDNYHGNGDYFKSR